MKLKFIIVTLLLFLSAGFVVEAKEYNVPKFDENTTNPGSSSGLSAPTTKFDIFENLDETGTNYASTRVINLNLAESKTFTLDFFTINWYAEYPSQELIFEMENKDIANVKYIKDSIEYSEVKIDGVNKTIIDATLPTRLENEKINPSFPKLEFSVEGLQVGTTCLKISVKSTHAYGDPTTTIEDLKIFICISDTKLIEIPNYINILLGSGIHSGAKYARYNEGETIGVLTNVVGTMKVILPEEITNYNDISTNKIMYKILTDKDISVSNDYLSFNILSGITSFTIEYYMVTSLDQEVEIASYSYSVVLYSTELVEVKYGGNEFPIDNIYESYVPITVSVPTWLEPYIEDIVIAYEPNYEIRIFPYINGHPYVIEKVQSETSIVIGDKLLALSGLSNYTDADVFVELLLKPDNVFDRVYPTDIILDEIYRFDIIDSIEEYIEITNINDFNQNTEFEINTNGLIDVSMTEDNRIKVIFHSEIPISTTLKTNITINAHMDNGVTLVKNIAIIFTPALGYRYTLNVDKIRLYQGETKTVMIGLLDPDFTQIISDLKVNIFQKTNNVTVTNSPTEYASYDITGFKVGIDTVYFNINDQIIELDVEIVKRTEKEIKQFNFNEGANLSILASKQTTKLTIPEEYRNIHFQFIILDNTIASVKNTSDTGVEIECLKDGVTQLFAYATEENVFYTAVINLRVITDIPNVYIVYEKNDNSTTLTKFDDIYVSFNASDFDFSKKTTYTWYLNDELIYDNIKSFTQKFNDGSNILKLVINDSENSILIETVQKIIISSIINEERTISINTDETIYVDLKQGKFEIEALLDGVINQNYKYFWSVSNSSICKIAINGNEKIVLEPNYVGEVTLTVMTNISKYEETFIKAEIKIVVIEPVYTITYNKFIKPGSTQSFKILGDTHEIYNLNPKITLNADGKEFTDYEMDKKEIVIHQIPKGKYKLLVEVGDGLTEIQFEVTNFNIKEIAKVSLPYLIVLSLIAIAIAILLKKRKNKLERTKIKINKLDVVVSTILENNDFTKKEIHKILKQSIQVKKMLVYCVDEGIDELSTLIPIVEVIIKILIATNNSNVDSSKIHTIIKNIKHKNIERLVKNFDIIQDERNVFEAKKKVTDEILKKQKKTKMTKEEYETFLIQTKYAEADSEDDEN
ncbi:MAG: hypothetical protein MR485_05600 [Mollicutes bacterium]|nr:hypothetical protein [Mollicutes bacterium]